MLIRSVIDYGAIAYDSAAPSHLAKLDVIQNTALRIACGATQGTNAASLEVDCGEPPLKLRRLELQANFISKVRASSNHSAVAIIKPHWTRKCGTFLKKKSHT